jgi:integrase
MARKPRKRPHGQGTIWNQGGTWWIRWREGGTRRTAKFPNRDMAERVLAKIVVDVAANRNGLAAHGIATTRAADLPTLSELAKPWIARREKTHRSWRDDRNRWNKHLEPFLGKCKPNAVNPAMIRRLVETKLEAGLSSTTVGHLVRLLSTFFTDVVEQGFVHANPARGLPRATRRLIRNAHDPKQTPFIEKHEDIRRVFLALEQPYATLFAVGALAGLRPGEILSLEWGDIDLDTRRLLVQRQVRHGRVGPPKSGKPRLVPIIEPLARILAEWKLATGGAGQLFRPANPRQGGHAASPARFLGLPGVYTHLRKALKVAGLPETLTLYECTRHTYGAQHVMGGGSLATLREVLGHSSVQVTERYGHLRADLFKAADLLKVTLDLSRPGGEVIDLAARRASTGPVDHVLATGEIDDQPAGGVSIGKV